MEPDMKMELSQLENQLSDVNNKVTSILHLLTGTELDEGSGLIYKVKHQQTQIDELKRRIGKLEKLKDRIIYIGIGLALPTTYGAASLISSLIKSISGK